jgi:hypothetical protein
MKPNSSQAHVPTIKLAAAALLGALSASWLASAQDPFGGPAPPAAGKDDKASKFKDLDLKSVLAEEAQKPLILKYLDENKPTTPEQFLRAAQITLNIRRPDESRKYLAGFLAAKPEDAALADLGRKLGADLFLRLSREKDVQPEGAQVGTLVLDALDRSARDPARIARLIGELADPDSARREVARRELAEGRSDAVLALIATLADASGSGIHRQAQVALVEMKLDSQGPLAAALESGQEALLVPVIETLGAMKSRKALARLVRLSVDAAAPERVRTAARDAVEQIGGGHPSLDDAERFLRKELERELDAAQILQPALDAPVQVWRWDAAAGAPAAMTLPPSDAALVEARQVAADLARLRPENVTYQRLKLLTALETDKVLAGLDRPLPQGDATAAAMAKEAGAAEVNAVLAEALKRQRIVGAVAAAEVLGQIGDSSLLGGGAGESPLALALRHSDRRLRFAAAMAITRIGPRQSFPGASRVIETLSHFAGTGGGRRVLIGHPRGGTGQTLVAYVNALGFEAQAAYTGRALQAEIGQSADYDFVLISDTLDGLAMKEVVQWLRRDYRTAQLPVGIMARGDNYEGLQNDFDGDRRTFVFLAPHDLEVARVLVVRLEEIAGRAGISTDERLDMAAAALDALAGIAEMPQDKPVYDVRRCEKDVIRALATPGLSSKAAKVLGLLGSHQSQTSLVEFASEQGRPLADRQAAAGAFAQAVRQRGLMLTKNQIRQQYDRYNASQMLDAQTQALLGSLLDTIESRAVAAAGTQP